MQLPSFFDPSTSRSLLPPGIGYLIIAGVFLFLLPNAFKANVTSHHLPAEGIVTRYQSSSTAERIAFSPVITFTDHEKRTWDVPMLSSSNEKLLPEGGAVSIFYLDTSSTQIILKNDPYRVLSDRLLRVVAIPYGVIGLLLLGLYLMKGWSQLVDWSVFGARIAMPWILTIVALIATFWHSSGEGLVGISFRENTGSQITGWQIGGIVFFVGYFIWYTLQWPLMVIRIVARAYRTHKENLKELVIIQN